MNSQPDIKVYFDDNLNILKQIKDKSIDMIYILILPSIQGSNKLELAFTPKTERKFQKIPMAIRIDLMTLSAFWNLV